MDEMCPINEESNFCCDPNKVSNCVIILYYASQCAGARNVKVDLVAVTEKIIWLFTEFILWKWNSNAGLHWIVI